MIDLSKFTIEKEVVVPIVDKWGQFEGRKIYLPVENGWWKVKLGNKIEPVSKASPLEIDKTISIKRKIKGYSFGEELIPMNFDNFRRKKLGQSIRVNFLNTQAFTSVEAVEWEDGRFYYYQEAAKYKPLLNELKTVFDTNKGLESVSKITPELRYYFLLITFNQENFRELSKFDSWVLTEDEKERRIKEFQNTFSGRLESAVTKAGGKLVKFTKQSKGFLVEWTVGSETIKSIIKEDMRLVSAGFCLSGDDKKHTMSSIINLAKIFQKNSPLYITRE